jgi:replicative DNA helicase
MSDELPPQEIEAEQSVIAAILICGWLTDDVSEILRPEDFYRWQHQTIYRAALEMSRANEKVDILTVSQKLRGLKQLEDAGGYEYLYQLVNDYPGSYNAVYHAKLVKQAAISRKAIAVGRRLVEAGFDRENKNPIETGFSLLVEAASEEMDHEVRGLKEIAPEMKVEIDEAVRLFETSGGKTIHNRIMTGLLPLDAMVSGVGKEDLVIVGGRASMGKSALLLQVAMNIASGVSAPSAPVALFSLEMSRSDIMKRYLAQVTKIPYNFLAGGMLLPDQKQRVDEALKHLASWPLYIDDSFAVSVNRIRAVSRRLQRKHGALGAIVVDYLGLIDPPKDQRKDRGRVQEISEMTRQFKVLAREIGCPVFLGCQINRESEKRQDKRPLLSELKDSGSVEQDGNLVILLYRDDYYNKDTSEPGVAELIVAKNRNGSTGTIKMRYVAQETKFYPLGGR